ncbi:phage tail sheath family protein [Pseudonocardia lacus]|uniref:phage tail sheath family protein n=1 Tax=Pseudonocardia lacus TaxID=2835865 RepID=UPI001BDC2F3B|nr:phage tail sheath subtilisin-like domain-containing protein [Pseudonocardia lacus]
MPEYLAPGVFVEEVSFRASSIAGVATSTTGYAGRTHYGPVRYPGGPTTVEPRLVTGFSEFERVYGGLAPFDDDVTLPFLAHAARAFFLNGGRRLYVSRVYVGEGGVASAELPVAQAGLAHLRARWPGHMGGVAVGLTAVRGGDVGVHVEVPGEPAGAKARGVQPGTILEVVPPPPPNQPMPPSTTPLVAANLRVLRIENDRQVFHNAAGQPDPPPVTALLLPVEVTVTVTVDPERVDVYSRLGVGVDAPRAIERVLGRDDPQDEDAVIWFDRGSAGAVNPIDMLIALVGDGDPTTKVVRLAGGTDGGPLSADRLMGDPADPDRVDAKATGLEALAEVDDIAIVAAPDVGGLDDEGERVVATQNLIRHAEAARYRIAVVDGPEGASLNEIRAFRGNFDSSYAAIYHPWLEVLDPAGPPAPGVPTPRLLLPPSGFVTGIYARTDVTRGVFKAPANEVVFGLTRFESVINQGRNEVLNPENINALRFFPGRGNRVWGARMMSSDPQWLYVNVRRLFLFLEHSIDRATQWAVFEPNGDALWRNVTQTVRDFLDVQWRAGALLGRTPEEAYFVRCDRSTMTQNDLDNGRLICLIGVAPVKPAEFVIFRIGQFTADARG